MSVVETQSGRLAVLEVEKPGGDVLPVGVLLIDPVKDKLYVRVRRDWDDIVPEEADVLEAMEKSLADLAEEVGATALLSRLQDTLSNTFRMREPGEVIVENFDRALARLYRCHVPSTVRPFVTHVPLYSVTVAAGKFLDNQEVEEENWVETPQGRKLTPGMFAARIAGRSMEPQIPDGSLCLFRAPLVNSREGKLVLVEALGRGSNDRYTVKRYRSEKNQLPTGEWSHVRIRLEPLNPDFEAWDLDPDEDKYRIFAEYMEVLEDNVLEEAD